MVAEALRALDPPAGSVVVIENVGNLVCPALFDLGEAARVVLASVTEGADKPLKYPHMFRRADLVLVTKIDLLPYVDFDVRAARAPTSGQVSPRRADARSVRARPAPACRPGTTGCSCDAWPGVTHAVPAPVPRRRPPPRPGRG